MNSSDPLYPFRLALSYLEKVEGEISSWESLRAARRTEVTIFDQVGATYGAHRKKALQVVEEFRVRATEDIVLLEEELHLQGRARKKLLQEASKGGLSAEEVNEQNRGLVGAIAGIEERLATARAIVAAETTGDVGGFETFSLKEYEKELIPPPPPEPKKRTWGLTPGVSAALVGVLILVGVAGYLFVTSGGSTRAVFKAGRLASDPSLIRVTCRNEGSRTLELYVPWPEGDVRTHGATASSYGILLYVVEREGKAPKLVPNSEGCWQYRGVYLDASGPISIRPQVPADVILDTGKLSELGIDATFVRLVFTRRGGTEVGRFETTLQ